MTRLRVLSATFAAISLIAGAPSMGAAAQAPPRPPSEQEPGARSEVAPGELQDLFDSYVMMQAQRQLRLTNDQLPQFILRLKALQTARRRSALQRLRIVQDLRRLTQPGDDKIDEAQVRERLKTLDDLEARSAAEIRQALAGLNEVLDVRQQARLRILEEQVEHNKLDLLMRARQRANRARTP